MRIGSEFKDYYDGVVRSLDHEPTPYYDRRTTQHDLHYLSREQSEALNIPLLDAFRDITITSDYIDNYAIAVCGKLYFSYENNYNLLGFCKDLEEHDGKISKFGASAFLFLVNRKLVSASLHKYSSKRHQRNVANFLTLDRDIGFDSHLALGTPIWMIKYNKHGTVLYLNPYLRDRNFGSQVDPYQMYQNLSYYFDNILVGQNDPPCTTGGDLIVRDAKGFDKWSFRRHKDDPKQ